MNKDAARARFDQALTEHEPQFEKYFLARFFGLQFSYLEDERCIVEVPVEDYMFNPQGTLHGGVIGFILDVSMGHLCKHFLGPAVTLEMKTQFLRPVDRGRIRCEASFLKKGRGIVSMESRIFDQNEKLLAIGTSTWHRI